MEGHNQFKTQAYILSPLAKEGLALMSANLNLNTRKQHVLIVSVIQGVLGQEGPGQLSVDLIILREVIVDSEPGNVRGMMFSYKCSKPCGIQF